MEVQTDSPTKIKQIPTGNDNFKDATIVNQNETHAGIIEDDDKRRNDTLNYKDQQTNYEYAARTSNISRDYNILSPETSPTVDHTTATAKKRNIQIESGLNLQPIIQIDGDNSDENSRVYREINEQANNEDNSITFDASPKEKVMKRSTSANPITNTPEDSKSKNGNNTQEHETIQTMGLKLPELTSFQSNNDNVNTQIGSGLVNNGFQRPGSHAQSEGQNKQGNSRLRAMGKKLSARIFIGSPDRARDSPLGSGTNQDQRMRNIALISEKFQADFETQNKSSFEKFYVQAEKIGEGMHSVVYKCFKIDDVEKENPFAVKISRNDDQEKKMVFEKEFKITKSLNHENIVKSYELFTNDFSGETHQVMDFVKGVEVFEQIARLGFYTEEDTKHLFKQILEAIEYMHEKNIAHRDIKPQNILVTDNNKVYIMDFNVSSLKKDDALEFVMMTKTGTVAFSAPEIFTSSYYNCLVDVWSAGVVLYMMFCGNQPFYEENVTKLVHKITHDEPEFNDEIFQQISEEGKDLLKKMLTKDPEQRPSAKQCLNHHWFQIVNISPSELTKSAVEDRNIPKSISILKQTSEILKIRAQAKHQGLLESSQVMKVENLIEDLLSNGIDLSNLDNVILNPTAEQIDRRRKSSIKMKRRNSNAEIDNVSASEDMTFSPHSKASPKQYEQPHSAYPSLKVGSSKSKSVRVKTNINENYKARDEENNDNQVGPRLKIINEMNVEIGSSNQDSDGLDDILKQSAMGGDSPRAGRGTNIQILNGPSQMEKTFAIQINPIGQCQVQPVNETQQLQQDQNQNDIYINNSSVKMAPKPIVPLQLQKHEVVGPVSDKLDLDRIRDSEKDCKNIWCVNCQRHITTQYISGVSKKQMKFAFLVCCFSCILCPKNKEHRCRTCGVKIWSQETSAFRHQQK